MERLAVVLGLDVDRMTGDRRHVVGVGAGGDQVRLPSRTAIWAFDSPSASRKCRAIATARPRSATRSYAGEGRLEAMYPGIAKRRRRPCWTDVADFAHGDSGCRSGFRIVVGVR